MTSVTRKLLELLEDDMVSHGLVAQFLKETDTETDSMEKRVIDVLEQLLATGRVGIGLARLKTPSYVEFVGWKGTVRDRVNRAIHSVAKAIGRDKEFAYWLSLSQNVDRFDEEDN